MTSFLQRYRFFFFPFFIWISSAALIAALTERNELHLWFNAHHQAWADVFFRYLTYMGDGVFGAFIVLLAMAYRIRYGVIGLIGLAGSGMITQLLKRQVFNEIQRPSKVFEQIADLHFVEGVQLHGNFSFPSGHATAAFSIFLLLAFIFRRPIWQLVCFVLALLVAFSRVYISQHFFEDIFAGSIIGTTITVIAFLWLHDKQWGQEGLIQWLEKRIRGEST
jgi:membrane-associated phospholipid phosphatase